MKINPGTLETISSCKKFSGSLSITKTYFIFTDPRSGLITTRQSLDRERKASYTLVLLVSDRGQPPEKSTRIVTVMVTDIDDHKPHFARNSVRSSTKKIYLKSSISINNLRNIKTLKKN